MIKRHTVPQSEAEGAGMGGANRGPFDDLKEMRQGVESMVDPFGMVAPLAHAHGAWGLHPMEFAELAMR